MAWRVNDRESRMKADMISKPGLPFGFVRLLAVLPILVVWPAAAFADVLYAVIDLGQGSGVYGINQSGQVVGQNSSGWVILYTGGQVTALGPGAGYGINDEGELVGQTTFCGGQFGFSDLDRAWTLLMPPVGGQEGSANAINNEGVIVGWSGSSAYSPQACLFDDFTATDLGTLGGATSEATGINDAGQVVGWSQTASNLNPHAFVYSGGVMTDLGTLLGLDYSEARAINNQGQIIIQTGCDSFLYSNGVACDLGNWGGACTLAYGINNNGQVVGQSENAGGAFVFDGTQMQGLNNLISPASGWALYQATAINDSGQIIGTGYNAANLDNLFLLIPIHATITSQPADTVTCAGSNATFSVTAPNAQSLQWCFNGANIPGATSSTLTISNVTPSVLGDYSVIVTDYAGDQITSSNALLEMYPTIRVPFTGANALWGATAVLRVTAWGTGPLSYQWFFDGSAISGATYPSLVLSGIQFSNAGLYSVVVSNTVGSVTNPPAQVTVIPAGCSFGLSPTITISGVVGISYVVQRTSNLNDANSWVTMANLTLANPTQIWVDTNMDASLPANPQNFYRVLPAQ
jgi:probable HAF family extracellular repeat protein